jgi:glyoxylase-like metal-dependent hydrolase (beta-lactamase superfamily II)
LVRRILAPNASPYTYTGTQTYLVGDDSAVVVIDPGPAEEAHLSALTAAIGSARHRDSLHPYASRPFARRRSLAAITGAPIIGCAPLTMEDDGPRADVAFDVDYRPDRILADGEQLKGPGFTLTAVATPGHTSNHLCFALEETRALFTGDHVMGWSTSVVAPPDGDMGDYMNSLQRLYDRQDRIYYPAHGQPIDRPHQFVRSMIGHRRQRERQIVKLLGEGVGEVPALVARMYVGLDPRLVGAAGRSVLAHLLDLVRRGLVTRDGEVFATN